ncbi:MAG: HNH endonuclease family protein [Acidobacteriota bacterium]
MRVFREDRWELVVGRLQAENFPDFLRAHWNSRHPFARHSDLFKTIRSAVRTRQVAFQLLREIEEDLDTYLALSSPEPSDWSPEDKLLAATLKLFRVRQPFPLLLAARRAFAPADFTALLRATVVISMRFNVIGSYSTGEQERRYNEVTEHIATRQLTTLTGALQPLRSIYPDDSVFRSAFANKTIRTTDSRNNKVVRFLLCTLEKHLSGQDHDFASDTFNIEHILPQNAPDGWGGIGNDDAEALLYRLGNMTLLESSRNRDLANLDYHSKRSVFEKSSFGITRKLAADHAEWTPDRIAAHQNWMATQAAALWRVPQLS